MDYKLLNVGNAVSIITDVQITKWGSEVIFSCEYDPQKDSKPYQVKFIGCRKGQWEIPFMDDVKELDAELTGFIAGEKFYKKAAIITTNVFEIAIEYENFVVLKDW